MTENQKMIQKYKDIYLNHWSKKTEKTLYQSQLRNVSLHDDAVWCDHPYQKGLRCYRKFMTVVKCSDIDGVGYEGYSVTNDYFYDNVIGMWEELSPILNSPMTGEQWFVLSDVQNIINTEEEKFNKLLDKFEKSGIIGKKVSATEAFKLVTEKGVPEDLIEIEDFNSFETLIENHKKISKGYT